jgi:LPXTG-site transpeptidase (sortase) family protein
MVIENLEEENGQPQNQERQEKIDIRDIVWDIKTEEINLDIEIIPFVNRVVIPKIAKNIPLVDINQGNVEDFDELNDVFMDELKWWVVRYPGSAKPWNFWNSFIFGHSSNFPWIEWDYNDVFALLDRLEIWDEIITYYEWQKYVYRIKEKKVINPNDVSVLKRDTGKKEITLMTCWPIGTTYNRLLLIGEIVNE